jgi:hypothetical protein
MGGSVYIWTSVPSAYMTQRDDPSSLHRRSATRDWWDQQLPLYESCISDAVVAELSEGQWPGREEAIALVQGLPRLAIDDEVIAVAERYVLEKLMPAAVGGDAMHLANPNKLRHLTVINRRMGLLTPQIVTPEMLWLEDEP